MFSGPCDSSPTNEKPQDRTLGQEIELQKPILQISLIRVYTCLAATFSGTIDNRMLNGVWWF
jgi:hypothetical protein